mmetsp:Transcript_59241/g.180661  ORF Transcript_59241/g.180661 Transcript_59241/m.180661 type:complete len:201 (-) Transcript_59241:126-728(-)
MCCFAASVQLIARDRTGGTCQAGADKPAGALARRTAISSNPGGACGSHWAGALYALSSDHRRRKCEGPERHLGLTNRMRVPRRDVGVVARLGAHLRGDGQVPRAAADHVRLAGLDAPRFSDVGTNAGDAGLRGERALDFRNALHRREADPDGYRAAPLTAVEVLRDRGDARARGRVDQRAAISFALACEHAKAIDELDKA